MRFPRSIHSAQPAQLATVGSGPAGDELRQVQGVRRRDDRHLLAEVAGVDGPREHKSSLVVAVVELAIVDDAARRSGERMVGEVAEVLCEGPSKTNAARLTGRTRTNKIVVFEGPAERTGQVVDIQVERANGFSLYGTPIARI